MKVLDSTFLIDVLRGKKETLPILHGKQPLLTTQINMYEVIRGLFLRNMPRSRMSSVLEVFESIRVLPLDDNAIISAAEISSSMIRKGTMLADCDCMTAGIALSKGITTIVTKNRKHFERIKDIQVEFY